MNQKVRSMLEGLYDHIEETSDSPLQAWDRMIEYIATESNAQLLLEINHGYKWLLSNPRLSEAVSQTYDRFLHVDDYQDHLGAMFYEKFRPQVKREGRIIDSKSIEQFLGNLPTVKKDRECQLIDPKADTGFLLMIAKQALPNAQLYGVEKDLRLYRICYTNCALHSLGTFLLHADPAIHETDITTEAGRANWRLANSWYPQTEKLRLVSERFQSKGGSKSE